MTIDLKDAACFGVAGNFTGHLEQAGEAADFKNVKTAEASAPKALFPTYIPQAKDNVPLFLGKFPFDSKTIIFPEGEEKIQIEPECGIVFNAQWKDGLLLSLKPLAFGASNDCSIRKAGAKKISEKKNWGQCSKGFSDSLIELKDFSSESIIDSYRIASFLVRDGKVYDYGEDSAVRDYSYVYEKLISWIIDRLNNQKNEGPAEDINSYAASALWPEKIFVSIGATRYTEFGEKNFLQNGDTAAVVLYPEDKYSHQDIVKAVENNSFGQGISALCQKVVV
ncbi:DUF5718 family protein [Treponema sp.]|uniref:DUF5718 family protein n=1 Tax=Treponema sp. TaxID=166 RepID=UPI0025D29E1A|nr:DUF5718 family protein [Treponema sp.]MCR5217121.1 DUF5718 family protein [Treponema sp.]